MFLAQIRSMGGFASLDSIEPARWDPLLFGPGISKYSGHECGKAEEGSRVVSISIALGAGAKAGSMRAIAL